ncbi:MAG TPA: hypothetical protein VIK62_01155 [Verrucomicrobiae bacterium]
MKILSVIPLSLAFVAKATDTNALPALVPAYGELPPTFLEQHGTIVLIGVLTLLILLTAFLWRLLKPKTPIILPPEIVAREALAKLQSQPEDGKVLSEVSQILHRYFSAEFEFPAGELTTAEFSSALAASEKISAELAQAIASFLQECDARKFSTSPAAAPLNAAERACKLVALAESARAGSHRQDACATNK